MTDIASRSEARRDWQRTKQNSPVVLLVEDNDILLHTIRLMVESLGYRVKTARTARQGLRVIEEENVDFVLSDIVMPGEMSGLDLAAHVRENRPHLPVLLMSGFADAFKDEVIKSFEILRKPFPMEDLEALLTVHLGARRTA